MEVYVVRNAEEEYDDVYFNIETADDVTGHVVVSVNNKVKEFKPKEIELKDMNLI